VLKNGGNLPVVDGMTTISRLIAVVQSGFVAEITEV
jgi:hypothetical protein